MCASVFSQEAEFYQASQLYKNGAYGEAIAKYESILEAGKASGPLYYNLGNCYFKEGNLGKAILNYMRAKKLLPRDSDVDFNLNYALSQIKYKSNSPEDGILKKLFNTYSGYFTLDEIMRIILMTYFLICLYFLIGLFLRWPRNRLIGPIGLLCIVLIFNFCVFIHGIHKYSQLVVAVEDIEARFEPIENATVHFKLSEGNTATILENKDGWIKIRRLDGKVGWTESHTIESI